ncbi:MAG: ribosomal L7Ae/L30e/S12e/Gadd45 family protein [Candidatus Cloacimonetes bacterium]|nr:ribosomal L7Ae/L30e/S12e/Gadd45 family protein [Candidatus Cloacimonadota bacterium]
MVVEEKKTSNNETKLISLLQIAFKANKLVYGYDSVLRKLLKKKVYLLILAKDLSESNYQSMTKHALNMKIDVIHWGNKDFYFQILGRYSGILGILDQSFKNGILTHIKVLEMEG